MTSKYFDYIFAGSGLATLMTVYKTIKSNEFDDKTFLIIDPIEKIGNDRTWCFWEKPEHKWTDIVSNEWETIVFEDAKRREDIEIFPYKYYRIKSYDFYNKIITFLKTKSNVVFSQSKLLNFYVDNNVFVTTNITTFQCQYFLNSILDETILTKQKKYPYLKQHFLGWTIKTKQEHFDETKATFMDFSIPQNGHTRFMYVLPFSKTEALFEPTLFSHNELPLIEYENEIKKYLKNLGITDYVITEKEQGCIPMTSYKFWNKNKKNVMYIGTAGGWTKASTGFTFRNADKKSDLLVGFTICYFLMF